MNLVEVKDRLYEATEMFFKGANVIWSEQITTKPPLPYVTLKVSGINRTSFPIIDGEGKRSYQCSTKAEVNLSTKGNPLSDGGKETGNYVNTAMSDLMEFSNFLESDVMVDFFANADMDVALMPPVRDLTVLQNDGKYRYRSMAEYMVSFTEEADGRYATSSMPMIPNSSGGGTNEMADAETDVIEEVVIEESTEGGKEDNEE